MAAAGAALHARRQPQAAPRSRKAEGGGREILLAGSQVALAVAGAVPLVIGVVTLLVITAPAIRRRIAYA